MGKKIEISDYRVEVWPQTYCFGKPISVDEEKRECVRIREEVKRHVVSGTVNVRHETTPCCEHCEGYWTEDNDTYNGGCCDKDEENNPEHPTPITVKE